MRALRTTDLSAMINVRMPECAFSNASSRRWEAVIKGDLVLLVRRYQRSDHSPRPGFPPCCRRRSSSKVDQPVAKENAEVIYRSQSRGARQHDVGEHQVHLAGLSTSRRSAWRRVR